MRANICKKCEWFSVSDEKGFFICTRYPPKWPPWAEAGESDVSVFPCVEKDDWCGEWRAKTKESGKTSANKRVTKWSSVASKRTAS